MRYGIVREGQSLPSASVQREGLERAGCEVVFDVSTPAVHRALDRQLFRLAAGDALYVFGLDALHRSAGEIAQLFRHLSRKGVSIWIAREDDCFWPILRTPAEDQLIDLFADHEDYRRGRPNPASMRRESRDSLSAFQVSYARKLHRQGVPLRTIGQIFQLPPDDIWNFVSEP